MNITKLDAHHKLFVSIVSALIIFVISYGKMSGTTLFMVTWIGYAAVNLVLSGATILSVHPIEMKKIAKVQDSNRTLIFLFVLTASLASLFGVVILLSSTQHLSGIALTHHILLSVASVISSWALVHTIFVFRYAHLYYESVQKSKPSSKKSEPSSKYTEGLEFPEENEPDYLDFTYFSFVIGMTFQVSDVEISSKRIRRLALMHSLVSFAFNTVIVALSINVISGLMSK